ncbi:leucine-rich repeat protein (LRRP), putative [Trypanosoma equiperdum]|uniref:Leucine-rich repeat protein (LRRP) n=2 Tax=Trypanozoon TaxID=39700 RepID=Q380Z8_TRYB2|nr:hypothetical protein, conserved [Trypanosoma brucei brucei TREU927]EAN80633.1 hypothetical protein, conserved [Trypanosoma brucei brucei TREU927]SCU70004.1 leucine-rich repeat protein (LRRP), putative [Trypanosoma equiperdum]
MLFEPSGDLRVDYSAFCHTLRTTEREEVYRSLITNTQQKAERETKHSLSPEDEAILLQWEEPNRMQTLQQEPLPEVEKAKENPTSKRHGTGAKREGATPSRKKSEHNDTSPSNPQPPPPPTVFYILMRHLKFCLNERDMKPLALAIPYCTSLVSVEFVGCGLSRESYFLLVEASYKSRRLVSMTVDFNCAPKPGFYEDPTIAIAPVEVPKVRELFPTEKNVPSVRFDDRKRAPSRDLTSLHTESVVTSIRADGQSSGGAASEALPTFSPSAYRGLNNVPSLLDLQIREERERKGKTDSKKQAQLQQQRETLAQFDRENRIPVPPGWPAALLTGVKHLSLRGNGISDRDAILTASLLSAHPRSELISLNLWGNNISDDGAVALARLLKKNRTLQVLDLGHNDIGDRGLAALVDCFRIQEMPAEELPAYRKRHLSRYNATAKEKSMISSLPPPYPSYQELYNTWHLCRYPTPVEDRRESKKGLQAKARKAEPAPARPTAPFDRDCFRLDDPPRVRAPGNTVLRCLNLGNNKRLTYEGAVEALRVLSLHEPIDDADMAMLRHCAVKPPEPYCVSISLSSFVVHHAGDNRLLDVQNDLSKLLQYRLERLRQLPVDDAAPVEDVKKRSPRGKK